MVEQPGPPDDPDDSEHEGCWQKLPASGLLAGVLAAAVQMLGPYIAPDRLLSDTSGTDD